MTSPFTTHSPNPLSRQFFTGVVFLSLKGIKALCSGYFFEPHIFMGLPSVRVHISDLFSSCYPGFLLRGVSAKDLGD